MTPERLAEIRKRCEAATKGKWRHGFTDRSGVAEEDAYGGYIMQRKKSPAHVIRGGTDDWGIPVGVLKKEDGDFIAHSRTDIPDLLDEIDRLRKELGCSIK